MKRKTIDHLKLTELIKITDASRYETSGKHRFLIKSIRFEDHEDWLMRISGLLKVCLLALDEENGFCSKNLGHKNRYSSLQLALEMVIELLPYQEMSRLHRISIILNGKYDDVYYPENLRAAIKNDDEK